MASCAKLVTTIATLQCVERGQVSLDEPVERILPELANPNIIKRSAVNLDEGSEQFEMVPSKIKITLRHLLSHTSGLAYDMMDPLLKTWRASRQEKPLGMTGKLMEAYVVPLLFEPGEGWAYSGGIDLAGEIVARLNQVSLEEYLQENVFGPLGMRSTTFRPQNRPELLQRLVKMTQREQTGHLTESMSLWPHMVQKDCGGVGLYSTVNDYTKILGDLLQEKPKILKPVTVDLLFAPQLERGSRAMLALHKSPMLQSMTGVEDQNNAINFGLGALYFEEDVGYHKKDSIVWSGLPNHYWFANRKNGAAGVYSSQIIPSRDPSSVYLAQEFVKHVYQVKKP
ncbi:beta-lactamase/transpeptidase-like protein [Plenodomus tracheiphilus IPT5]|uniref:Beta-lactamase/transpeptidase-like protein n=1 Tax=Plenodomus tracheiphilus IPT5 TaxID=1408161 RepID=A0A6A7APA1_9PLEO|nr:beta-lactamase/transpeptidase-like protein [Plenodomus tracheiphilus IPT5]